MDTEKELNAAILKITLTIQNKYPELSKYLAEMPVSVPNENDPHINKNSLKEYLQSLNELLHKYILEHSSSKDQQHP